MSEVKRYKCDSYVMRYRHRDELEHPLAHVTETVRGPVTVIIEADHDRVVAEKDESYDKLDNVNMKLNETIEANVRHIDFLTDEIATERKTIAELNSELTSRSESLLQTRNDWLEARETIAAQSLVIEKLKEQRDDLAHDAAYEINYGPHPKEALEKIKELDAELAALTKQPEPKEGA